MHRSFLPLLALSFVFLSGCATVFKQKPRIESGPANSSYTTTPSGLQYRIIREGTGRRPTATDAVLVEYQGLLVNGTVFDRSQPGRPVSFSLNHTLRGWSEGLQLMREGAQYRFMIPPQLGYGERGGAGGVVPPNATLVFEISLLKVE